MISSIDPFFGVTSTCSFYFKIEGQIQVFGDFSENFIWAVTVNALLIQCSIFQTIVQGQKGWDFLVSWVMHSINARKRRRLVRNSRQESNMEEGEAAEYWADESEQSNPSINNSFRKNTHFNGLILIYYRELFLSSMPRGGGRVDNVCGPRFPNPVKYENDINTSKLDFLRTNEMRSRCTRSGSQKESSHSRPQQQQQHVGNHLPGGS